MNANSILMFLAVAISYLIPCLMGLTLLRFLWHTRLVITTGKIDSTCPVNWAHGHIQAVTKQNPEIIIHRGFRVNNNRVLKDGASRKTLKAIQEEFSLLGLNVISIVTYSGGKETHYAIA